MKNSLAEPEKAYKREVEALKRTIKSPHTVNLRGYCTDPYYCIVTDLCDAGSLETIMRKQGVVFTTEQAVRIAKQVCTSFPPLLFLLSFLFDNDESKLFELDGFEITTKIVSALSDYLSYFNFRFFLLMHFMCSFIYLTQVAEGMKYLHALKPPLLHRDISAGNIFLHPNIDGKVCIGDFGIAIAKTRRGKQKYSQNGNPRYRAPEVSNGEPYSRKVLISYYFVFCFTFS